MARTGNPLPTYKHQPLSHPDSLRLFKLWHGDERTEELVCDLFEVGPDQKSGFTYEALSWTWDPPDPTKLIKINKTVNGEDVAFAFSISPNLYLALKALRYETKSRVLWVDAICINQDKDQPDERNHQIPMMPSIYGDAEQVCVWLGGGNKGSDMAIDFIERIMKDIWKLDQLCEDPRETDNWAELLTLIMRPWFSRRWIVQEIALARKGLIYCGRRTISWRTFSDAVSLFVEVETATHRLSEIMKTKLISNYIPDFFNDVADLSATLLIDTTNNLFRKLPNGRKDSILSLEFLVSRLCMFNTTHPCDAVYSLLAIAKNTNPSAASRRQQNEALAIHQISALARDISSKPFYVDYDQPYTETCKDFIEFSIRQSEASRALDILCRPWAPRIQSDQLADAQPPRLPSWIRSVKDAAFEVNTLPSGQKIGRVSADALVGLPTFGQRNYSAAETKKLDLRKLRFAKRSSHYSMFVEGFIYDEVGSVEEIARDGNLPITWLTAGNWNDYDVDPPDELWRTLVANRGPDGKNALTFYQTAFRESLQKGRKGGILTTAQLIHYGQCSIVAQFLRRMQAVIWNRRLIFTKGHVHETNATTCKRPEISAKMGLGHQDTKAGHLICFLYGCTVPILLNRVDIPLSQVEIEREEDKESKLQEAKITVRRVRDMVKKRREIRELRKTQLRELQRIRGLSEVDRTPASHYCKRKKEVKIIPPWVERLCRDYQILATFCLPIFASLCLQVTETKALTHLLLSLGLGLTLTFALAQRKIVRAKISSVVERCAVKLEPWVKTMRSWQAKIRPRPNTHEPLEENVRKYYYEFVGECYLHGMMDGEAIKYQNDHQIQAEMFEIR